VREDARSADEISPRDLSFLTVQDIYLNFFLGEAAPIRSAAPPDDAGGAPGTLRTLHELRDAPEPVSPDR
jgi:hypothetical protein